MRDGQLSPSGKAGQAEALASVWLSVHCDWPQCRGAARVWVQEMRLHPVGCREPLMASEQMSDVSRLGFRAGLEHGEMWRKSQRP